MTTCYLDSNPHATEIAGWLRQGLTAAAVNANLKLLDPEQVDIHPTVFSRHRTKCLGMAKLSGGRGNKKADPTRITAEEIAAIPDEDVTADEVKDLALRAFYARLKKNPADVGMKELVSVISALTRTGAGGKTGKGAVEEAMANLD